MDINKRCMDLALEDMLYNQNVTIRLKKEIRHYLATGEEDFSEESKRELKSLHDYLIMPRYYHHLDNLGVVDNKK